MSWKLVLRAQSVAEAKLRIARSDFSYETLEQATFKTGKVRLRLQWRIQDTGDARAMGSSLKAMAGTDWGQSTRVTHRQTTEKIRDPKSIRTQMMPPAAPDAGHEATGFAVCPVLARAFLIRPHSSPLK